MLAALVSSVALAESVWEDDGSLTIIDSSEKYNEIINEKLTYLTKHPTIMYVLGEEKRLWNIKRNIQK